MREAVVLNNSGGDVDVFIQKAEKLYCKVKFNESAMRGFLRDAIPPLSRFVVLRNAVTVTEIDEACASYVEGQKLLYRPKRVLPQAFRSATVLML